MTGKILNFDARTKTGIISAEDGNRYEFSMDTWKGETMPPKGSEVDFVVYNDKAVEVYPIKSAISGEKSKVAAALLAFFLGAFGVHKFYLGYNKEGIIMLLVWLFGLILLAIPSLIIGLIAFIEFIIYLTKSDQEFDEIYVQNKRGWF